MLSERENYLRAVTMTGPEWIPCRVGFLKAVWNEYRDALENVLVRHPILFPNFVKGRHNYSREALAPYQRAGEDVVDAWGCHWRTDLDGMTGQVVHGPLANWSALDSYVVPDAERELTWGPVDWRKVAEDVARQKAEGRLTSGFTDHGFIFLRLSDLRGFDNVMVDMAAGEPRLRELIARIEPHYATVVRHYVEMGVDVMEFGDDLGMQTSSVMGPRHFREWIAPTYRRLMTPCREKGVHVALHSDGYIMDIMDDILAAGVSIVNPQDLVNGIDDLAREVKGRVCIRLDVDRQRIVPFGTPADIRALIKEEVLKLGSPQGGLELLCQIIPPTPLENVEAVCCAMEEYRRYWV